MKNSNYPLKSIPFYEVELNDHFWASRIKIHREVTIPHVLKKCKSARHINNFELAGGLKERGKTSKFPFDDSDFYKIMEGIGNVLYIHKDPKLEEISDDFIDKIGAAQEEDGYLYTHRTINSGQLHYWAGKERWELVTIFSHELYNVGHLYESAAAYYLATGKRKLLDIAIKNANLVNKVFGSGKNESPPGHQEIELGLIKLYQITDNEAYLNLAKFFLDIRGDKNREGREEYEEKSIGKLPWKGEDRFKYNQTHARVIEQEEATGHAVRALYMYAAMVDIGVFKSNNLYLKAIDKLWDDVYSKKMYITGGLGNEPTGEAFGAAYVLPNVDAYTETCAAIASVFWNHRLFLHKGNSKYYDILERTLYNGLLSGYSLDGRKFFYTNPLYSDGEHRRKLWYSCACCPSNITRFIPTVSGYIYALRENTLYINLFISSKATFSLGENSVTITQETEYPWKENISCVINTQKKINFNLALRIPGWARNKPVPSDLYQYKENISNNLVIKVNENEVNFNNENGYAILSRIWEDGDKIELTIPMPIRRVISNEKVKNNNNKVAIERGPLVYCLESEDNDIPDFKNIKLNDNTILTSEYIPNLLNGIVVIKGKINYLDDKNQVKENDFVAIPYYAWAHRGSGEMTVWFGRK